MTAVTAPAPGAVAATILSGASITAVGLPVYGKLVGIIIPAAWTAAAITFQASTDAAGTYTDVWDSANTATATERTLASANIPTSGGRFLPLSLNDWLSIKFVKVRSGTSAAAVPQGADRVITLVTCG